MGGGPKGQEAGLGPLLPRGGAYGPGGAGLAEGGGASPTGGRPNDQEAGLTNSRGGEALGRRRGLLFLGAGLIARRRGLSFPGLGRLFIFRTPQAGA